MSGGLPAGPGDDRHPPAAGQGAHAVAGDVRLDDDQAVLPQGRHERVHGANLGLRGDVYLAVGGFGPLSTGEDQYLWDRVKLAGFLAVTTPRAPVTTSSRLRGRASGGLADLLAALRPPA